MPLAKLDYSRNFPFFCVSSFLSMLSREQKRLLLLVLPEKVNFCLH